MRPLDAAFENFALLKKDGLKNVSLCWQAVHVHCIATEPTFFGNYAPPDDLDGQIIDLAPQQSMMYTLKPPVQYFFGG